MSKELMNQKDKELVSFEELENDGFGDIQDDLKPNFLKIAQTNTACANKDDPTYSDGLEPGVFYDSQSKTNLGKTPKVVVLGRYLNYVIWVKGDLGSYRGSYTEKEFNEVKDKLNPVYLDNGRPHPSKWEGEEEGTEVVKTQNFFIYLPDHPEIDTLCFTMSSSALRQYREWINLMNSVKNEKGQRADIAAVIYQLGLTITKNDRGESWYSMGDKKVCLVKKVGLATENADLAKQVITRAKAIRELIKKDVSIDYSNNDSYEVEEETDY